MVTIKVESMAQKEKVLDRTETFLQLLLRSVGPTKLPTNQLENLSVYKSVFQIKVGTTDEK